MHSIRSVSVSIHRRGMVRWLLAVCLSTSACSRASNEYVLPPPPTVTFSHPVAAPITPFIDENGITEAASEAEVRSRVRGFLQSVEFEPGQSVKQGDVLYQIERGQYEAAHASAKAAVETAVASIAVAEAKVKTAEAEVLRASQELDREERLKTQNASSQAQYDAAVAGSAAADAARDSALASVMAAKSEKARAEAVVLQAKLDLDYTVVQAEIAGQITKTNFKVGNLVENGSHLATIVNDEQVFANFSVSDRAVLRLMNARRLSGVVEESDRDWKGIPVYLAREGDDGYPFEGSLDYVDQAGVESTTGTLGLRGVFQNASGELLPGLFVSLRVPAAAQAVDSMLIPERAILRDQLGTYVLVIGDGNRIDRSRVKLGQAVSGWAIILTGLEPDMRVVVDGLQFARPGLEVVPSEARYELDPMLLMRGLSQSDGGGSESTESGQ